MALVAHKSSRPKALSLVAVICGNYTQLSFECLVSSSGSNWHGLGFISLFVVATCNFVFALQIIVALTFFDLVFQAWSFLGWMPKKADPELPPMDVKDLGREWGNNPYLRDRLRLEKRLFTHPLSQRWCEPTRINACNNKLVLEPMLVRLQETEDWKLPYLEALQVEVSNLFESCGVPQDPKMIYTAAVEGKRLLGFIKRRCKRREVTKDSFVVSLQSMLFFWLVSFLTRSWRGWRFSKKLEF